MSGWTDQSFKIANRLSGYRPGWRGLWDHLLVVLLRRKPPTVQIDTDLVLSLRLRGDAEICNVALLVPPLRAELAEPTHGIVEWTGSPTC